MNASGGRRAVGAGKGGGVGVKSSPSGRRRRGALQEYERKRRFDVTTEPPPTIPAARGRTALRFVVQKHRASHLHYDFRLEWDGVLLSWAVPKGPSFDPQDKRLAMAVEDHPLDYADFEGIIPEGEYGGGTVMVWDRGTYAPKTPDVGKSRQAGRLDFTLKGKKLKGDWVLVRTRGRDSRTWLLIKRRDAAASTDDVLEKEPHSVKSKRLMAEIAFDEGGDVERAAKVDPAAAIQALMQDPRTETRSARQAAVWHSPAVWHSAKSVAPRDRATVPTSQVSRPSSLLGWGVQSVSSVLWHPGVNLSAAQLDECCAPPSR